MTPLDAGQIPSLTLPPVLVRLRSNIIGPTYGFSQQCRRGHRNVNLTRFLVALGPGLEL